MKRDASPPDLFGDTNTAYGGGIAGYAAAPGTGPKGMHCGECKQLIGHGTGRLYFKCRLVAYTFGPATDIRARTPACSRFEHIES